MQKYVSLFSYLYIYLSKIKDETSPKNAAACMILTVVLNESAYSCT